jgi:transposase
VCLGRAKALASPRCSRRSRWHCVGNCRSSRQRRCCADKQLWRRIEHYVDQARALDDMSTVQIVGIDDTSLHRGQSYITVVHDLDAKRLLFATQGRDHQTVLDFAVDLQAHGGDPEQVRHVCQDMSAAYAKGVGMALPNAAISYERFHVVAMAVDAMDKVRQA